MALMIAGLPGFYTFLKYTFTTIAFSVAYFWFNFVVIIVERYSTIVIQ